MAWEKNVLCGVTSLSCIVLSLVGGLCLAALYQFPYRLSPEEYDAFKVISWFAPAGLSAAVAKERWELKNGMQNGAKVPPDEIAGELENGMPECPDGGIYDVGIVGVAPSCSGAEHSR